MDVDLVGVGEPGEGLEGSGVFHTTDGVGAFAVGLVFDPVAGPLVHELPCQKVEAERLSPRRTKGGRWARRRGIACGGL